MNFNEFVLSERASRDTIDVKRIYIDMADDLVSGILLSQIIYWYLPDKNGKSKLRVRHEGEMWIAKTRADWWLECRITERQYDRAIRILEEKEFVKTDTTLFAGKPSKVIRLDFDNFMSAYRDALERSYTKCKNEVDERLSTITEITSEITTDIPPTAEKIPSAEETPAETYVPLKKSEKQPCGHPVTSIRGTDEGTHYCYECAAEEQFVTMPSQSTEPAPTKRAGSRAGVADPTIEQAELTKQYADAFAEILDSAPLKEHASAARKMISKKWYRDNRQSVDNLLAKYRNGDGAQFRKDGQNAYFILTALERALARHAEPENDLTKFVS